MNSSLLMPILNFFVNGTVGSRFQFLVSWFLLIVLVWVFIEDWRSMIIRRSIVLPTTVLVFIMNLLEEMNWWKLLLGVLIGGGFFWIQYELSHGRWVGRGDIYLGCLMGAALGWTKVFLALLLAYVAGAFVGLILVALGKKNWQSQLSFGTFLSVATVVTIFAGNSIVNWYLSLF